MAKRYQFNQKRKISTQIKSTHFLDLFKIDLYTPEF